MIMIIMKAGQSKPQAPDDYDYDVDDDGDDDEEEEEDAKCDGCKEKGEW